jgi:molecular chaperone GrpE
MAKNKKEPKSVVSDDQASLVDITKQEELEGQLKRALADYQNLERRVAQERQLLSQLSSALVIEKFLPVIDNLESAQSHLNDQGLAMVIKQFNDVLQSEGVEQIQAEGQQFDPNLHEAAEVTEEGENGKVVKVLAKGYKIRDRVIRPAKVIVSRKAESVQKSDKSPVEPADQIAEEGVVN